MKSNYRNYFKDGKLYQWNKDNTVFTITSDVYNKNLEFCLDKFGMDMLLKFDNPTVILENNQLKVEAGNIKASIPTIAEGLMIPKLKEVSEEQLAMEPELAHDIFDLPIDALKYATSFVGTDPKKVILTGVNIQNKRVNASDSFSAYSKEFDIDEKINLTIPKPFIDEISKVAKGILHFESDGRTLYTVIEGVEYYSVLLEGSFPNVSKIFAGIESSIAKTITSDKNEIQSILNYVMVSDGKVILSDYLIQVQGENTDIQSMCNLDMGEFKIILSLSKFKAALNAIDTDELVIKIKADNAPIILNDSVMLLPRTQ